MQNQGFVNHKIGQKTQKYTFRAAKYGLKHLTFPLSYVRELETIKYAYGVIFSCIA